MTGTELATRPVGALALDPRQTDWTERQHAALQQLGLAKAPAGDLAVFLHQAQRTGLDPFTKQIYMIGRWDAREQREKYTIQTGIDGFRVIAERPKSGQPSPYGGQVGPMWCGEDGQWRDVWPFRKPPVAARIGVIRKDWAEPIYAVAHFHEYAQTNKKGELTRMWAEKPAVMIAKCAEALALRKAFPHDLSGIYTAEEMPYQEPTQVTAERADQPTPAAAESAPAEPTAEPVDWQALLEQAAGDYDALRALWSRAVEADADADVMRRIVQAGEAAKAAAEEPLDAEIVDEQQEQDNTSAAATERPPAPPAEPQQLHADPPTPKQLTKLHTQLRGLAVIGDENKHETVSLLVGRPIESTKQLTRPEINGVIDLLERCLEDPQPVHALDTVLAELANAQQSTPDTKES